MVNSLELLGTASQEVKKINGLLSVCIKSPHTESINKTAISLNQLYRMKVPDALIEAAAIEQKIPLLTFDKDFIKIKEVDLVLLEL